MPKTVKAKYLLGWMSQHEAVDALNACVFQLPLTKKKAIALWKEYREKVEALKQRRPDPPSCLPLTDQEKNAVDAHMKMLKAGAMGTHFSSVLKVEPENLIARQYYVITERADQ